MSRLKQGWIISSVRCADRQFLGHSPCSKHRLPSSMTALLISSVGCADLLHRLRSKRLGQGRPRPASGRAAAALPPLPTIGGD